MDEQIALIIKEGEDAINAFGDHSNRLAQVMAKEFPAVTLEAVGKEFKGVAADGKTLNDKVTKLSTLLREEAAVAVHSFRQAEMWLRMKSPVISDGNNFGVDVQNWVLEEIKKMREAMEAMGTTVKDYHWARASGVEKIAGDTKAVNESSKTDDDDGEKKTSKTSASNKTTSTKPEPYADYTAYLTAVDVKQYHTVFSQLTAVRNSYITAHCIFSKNMKRLNDPRGEGEDGQSRNVMSMF